MLRRVLLLASLLIAPASASAQAVLPPLLITWAAPGALQLPTTPPWTFQSLSIYDNGNRPVVFYVNSATQVDASFIVFKNLSGKPTSKGCLSDVIEPLVKHLGKDISERRDGNVTGGSNSYAEVTYLLKMGDTKFKQRNTFAFAGDKDLCTEIHLSTVTQGLAGETQIQLALSEFKPRLGYATSADDLFQMGEYLAAKTPEEAAPYFGEALPKLAPGAGSATQRRMITDRLNTALGRAGHFDGVRHFAGLAIETDPDYPMNYYNLACADAEEGKAAEARVHLEQAFVRKANTLQGETMPDPSKDSSILKLKSDKTFWAFVQTLK